MKTFNLTFDGLVDTQYGKKSVWHSKSKPEPKQKSIKEGLDLSHLEAGKTYSVTMDENNYWTVVAVAEPSAFTGPRRGGNGRVYDPLQFVSNVVGNAIQSQLIKDPSDIQAWAEHAWKTANFLEGALNPKAESGAETKEESGQSAPAESSAYPEGPWTCPNCGEKKVGKSKYGPQWYCFACKAKYAKDAPEICGQFGGEIAPPPKEMPNDEIPF